jgi:hypothetical protein
MRDEKRGLTGLRKITILSECIKPLVWDRNECTGEMSRGRWENELNGLTALSISIH